MRTCDAANVTEIMFRNDAAVVDGLVIIERE